MNNTAKTSVWVLLGAAAVGFATHGTKIIEALHAAWLFLIGMSKEAPLGLTSFLLAVAVSVLVQLFLRRHWRPAGATSAGFSTRVDSIGVAIGIAAMYVQLSTTKGMLLAIMAGFVSPWVSRLVATVVCLSVRRFKKKIEVIE